MTASVSTGCYSLLPPEEGLGMRDHAINAVQSFNESAPLTLTLSQRERGLKKTRLG